MMRMDLNNNLSDGVGFKYMMNLGSNKYLMKLGLSSSLSYEEAFK